MLVLNEHGIEVEIGTDMIPHLQKRGIWHLYKPSPRTVEGDGPEKSICLLLNSNGIGDAIHAMPAIWQKIQDGYNVTVLAEEFYEGWYTKLGATFIPLMQGTLGFVPENKHKYSKFYSLKHWCIQHDEETYGSPNVDRFQQFANFIGTRLPDAFDWSEFLTPNPIKCDVALGLDSTAKQRCYPYASQLNGLLKAKKFKVFDIGRNKGQKRAESLQDMVNWVAGAEVVIAVDSGILAIALALRKPTVALFGPTSEQVIVRQFERFQEPTFNILRSEKVGKCERPCNFQRAKGFGVDGKCTSKPVADCMLELKPEQVVQKVLELIN